MTFREIVLLKTLDVFTLDIVVLFTQRQNSKFIHKQSIRLSCVFSSEVTVSFFNITLTLLIVTVAMSSLNAFSQISDISTLLTS